MEPWRMEVRPGRVLFQTTAILSAPYLFTSVKPVHPDALRLLQQCKSCDHISPASQMHYFQRVSDQEPTCSTACSPERLSLERS